MATQRTPIGREQTPEAVGEAVARQFDRVVHDVVGVVLRRPQQLGRIAGAIARERVTGAVGKHDGIERENGGLTQPQDSELPLRRERVREGERIDPTGSRRMPPTLDRVGGEAEDRKQERDATEDRRRLSPAEAERADAVDEHRRADAERDREPERGEREPRFRRELRPLRRDLFGYPDDGPPDDREHPRARRPREPRAGGDEEGNGRGHEESPHHPPGTRRTRLEAQHLGEVEVGPECETE